MRITVHRGTNPDTPEALPTIATTSLHEFFSFGMVLPPDRRATRASLDTVGFCAFSAVRPYEEPVTIVKAGRARSRSCKVCDCTWTDACPEGCAWYNAQKTVCTKCDLEGEPA